MQAPAWRRTTSQTYRPWAVLTTRLVCMEPQDAGACMAQKKVTCIQSQSGCAAGWGRTIGAVLLDGLAAAGERVAVDLVLDLGRRVGHEDGAGRVARAHLPRLPLQWAKK